MAKPELSPFVLVLRENGERAGRGYTMELAPMPSGGASPRAHGSSPSRAAPTVTPPRAHGSNSGREAATGTSPRVQEGRSTAGPPPRAHGDTSTTTRRVATGPSPWARGSIWTSEAATGAPRHAHGPSTRREAATCPHPRARSDAATDGGAASGARGDAAYGGDSCVADGDPSAPGMERILQDMRDLLYPESPNNIKKGATKNRDRDSKNAREIIIPVFLAPKLKSENKKDEIWNKRQIIYGIALLGPLGLVLAVPAIWPRWMIFLFTVVWGFGSVGFPMGLYGTSRCEMDYSRHFARFIFMGFSLFVIYTMYRSMMLLEASSPSCSPPSAADMASPPSPATQDAPHVRMIWTLAFGIVGGLVMVGHMFSWVRGFLTGSDRDQDESESSGEELSTSDLQQRLLDRR